jgi:hypothetical protein
MKYLDFTLYLRGNCGLSNLMMSMELGVVASFLLDRVLVLEGNVSPPANLVSYLGMNVDHRPRSRVTDLVELPVPWLDAWQTDYDPAQAVVMCRGHAMDAVFPWPDTGDPPSADLLRFARGRRRIVRQTEASRAAPVVRLFPRPAAGTSMENFSFYSYFFYLDAPTRSAVHALLRRMRPRAPYVKLAGQVSASLGRFNAVHVRRGDFKETFGVTTRDRSAAEAIRVLDESFAQDDTLVILTDERNDPFFGEITAHFCNSIFVDHYILEHFHDEFFDLPYHDGIALAYLSQLVAADAVDFVGTMTSTFTSMVQRYRGNRGRVELFKFLWNEIPDPAYEVTLRGSHPPSACVPLHPDGRLVEQFAGPYSWLRYNERINPAWQREWPESFLEDAACKGTL